MVNNGVASVFIRVFFQNEEISAEFSDLEYTYDEEDDDELVLTIQSANRTIADHPGLQQNVELRVIWGYINGKTSKTRTVIVRECKWDYRGNVTGKITCTEKGAILKSYSSKAMYQGQSMLDIVAEKADQHGLNPILELSGSQVVNSIDPYPGEGFDHYLKRRNSVIWDGDLAKAWDMRAIIRAAKEAGKTKTSRFAAGTPAISQSMNNQYGMAGNVPEYVTTAVAEFKVHDNVPQANRSDKAFLKELGKRENNGQWFVETRDNDIIVKRRNFNQNPYRAYEYKGTDGELLEFSPEYKQRKRKSTSAGMGFAGWDAKSKEYFQGQAGGDLDPKIARFIEQYNLYVKEINMNPLVGNTVVGTRIIRKGYGGATAYGQGIDAMNGVVYTNGNRPTRPVSPNRGKPGDDKNYFADAIGDGNGKALRDKTLLKVPDIWVPITLNDRVKAMKAVLDEYDKKKKENADKFNSLNGNPVDAYNDALNSMNRANEKKQPATGKVWGDPDLVVGMLLTIVGVGKKHAGNYYITKAVHKVSANGGYYTDWEGFTQGSNLPGNDTVDFTELGQVNTKVGTGNPKSKPIKVKGNGH